MIKLDVVMMFRRGLTLSYYNGHTSEGSVLFEGKSSDLTKDVPISSRYNTHLVRSTLIKCTLPSFIVPLGASTWASEGGRWCGVSHDTGNTKPRLYLMNTFCARVRWHIPHIQTLFIHQALIIYIKISNIIVL